MENSKELFVKAFIEAERLANSKIPNEDEIEWEFSDKFLRKMDKLIKKNNRIKLSTRRTVTKGLIAAIVAITVLLTSLMSVSATRKPIIEFVKKVFSQFNEITLSENSPPTVDKIETEYTLTYLPEGFKLDTYQKDDYSVLTVWKNGNEEKITFIQYLINSNSSFDTEHGYEELDVNGYKAYYYASNLTWTDGVYWFTLGITNGEKTELLELSKNISEKI